ncbi:hypothetical protein GCM10018980_72280 [Streptomyces capoamus]|uniref:Transposase n=1 Tax=Streptomyces capoamus TaxID=68183 RepID=A0A919KFK1_9ACTN|nr:hypothetical protein GCM10010501_16920 [Streptomyces libani subsp. rufus]GHG75030.1 hypothetical protein GCM10018980_72280 [Streptomyces capoamus]
MQGALVRHLADLNGDHGDILAWAIADTTCSATTIRNRHDEWIRLGVFAKVKQIALESYDRIVGLELDQIAVDGAISKAPGGGEVAGRSPGVTNAALHGRIARKGEKAPIQASQRWHVERPHAWLNAFHRLARCYERRASVIEAFFNLTDTIITVRSLIRRAWTTHRWDERPNAARDQTPTPGRNRSSARPMRSRHRSDSAVFPALTSGRLPSFPRVVPPWQNHARTVHW